MTAGKDILAKAKTHIGEAGGPTWTWWNKHAWNFGTGWAWCCAFVNRVFYECGASKLFYGGGYTASVGVIEDYLYRHAKWVKYSEAKAGDLVIFTWKPTGASNTRSGAEKSHIGIFEERKDANTFYAVEGNTGPNPAHVMRRERSRAYIYAIYRPNYATPKKKAYAGLFPVLPKRGYFKKGDKGDQVKRLQRLMNWINAGSYTLAVDGVYGPNTKKAVKKAQKRLKVVQTGNFGRRTLAAAKKFKR